MNIYTANDYKEVVRLLMEEVIQKIEEEGTQELECFFRIAWDEVVSYDIWTSKKLIKEKGE